MPCRVLSHPDAIPQAKRSKHHQPPAKSFLDSSLVGERSEGLRGVVTQRNCSGITGTEGLSLDGDGLASGLGLLLRLSVGLHSLQEILSRSGRLDVLDSDVDSLLDVSVLDLLVDDDTDSGLGDVVDDTSLSVVDLEGHTISTVSPRSFDRPILDFAGSEECVAKSWGSLTPSERHRSP